MSPKVRFLLGIGLMVLVGVGAVFLRDKGEAARPLGAKPAAGAVEVNVVPEAAPVRKRDGDGEVRAIAEAARAESKAGLATKTITTPKQIDTAVADLQRRVGDYQAKMEKYRQDQPVFLEFLKVLDETLLPMAKRGAEAKVQLSKFADAPPVPVDGQKIVAAFLGAVADEALAMGDEGTLDLEGTQAAQLQGLVAEADDAEGQPFTNPYVAGTADYYSYDAQVSAFAVTAARSLFVDVLQYGSPELEDERDMLTDELDRTRAQHDCGSMQVDSDPYEDLVRERLQYLSELADWSAGRQKTAQ